MPIVRADLPQGLSDEIKEALRQALKAAVVSALAPKETRYIYVALREVFAPVGDGAPTVTVDLRSPRPSYRRGHAVRRRHRRRGHLPAVPRDPGREPLLRRHAPAQLGAGRWVRGVRNQRVDCRGGALG